MSITVKIVIKDDCRKLPIQFFYEGPNVHVLYPGIKELIMDTLVVSLNDIHEKSVSISRKGESEKIKASFEVVKRLDSFTYMFFEVSLSVEQKPSEKFESEGKASVKIKGKLFTELPQETTWQRSFLFQLLWTTSYILWYKRQREKYLEECKELMFRLERNLKKLLRVE